MALPTIKQPTFNDTLPDARKFVFRPFLTEEQKALLIAAQGGDETNLIRNMIDLVNACTFEKFNFYNETIANFEKAFLCIRSKSVGEIIEIGYRCLNTGDDGKPCNHKNFQEVDYLKDTVFTSPPDPIIDIDGTIKVKLKNLTMNDILNDRDIESIEFLFEHVEMIIDGEEIFMGFTIDEFKQFASNIPAKANEAILSFFINQSAATLEIPTLCKKCRNKSSVSIKGAVNFFG